MIDFKQILIEAVIFLLIAALSIIALKWRYKQIKINEDSNEMESKMKDSKEIIKRTKNGRKR